MLSEKEVFDRIKSNLQNRSDEDASIGNSYTGDGTWTPIIREVTESTIKSIINKESGGYNREYYKVDSLFWEYTERYDRYIPINSHMTVTKSDIIWLNNYKWKVTYAIEYENNKNTWTDELVKLSHLRAGMKIIISYSQSKCEATQMNYEDIINVKLKYAKDMLKSSCPESLNDNWLIIFLPNNEFNLDKLVGYKMENKEFLKII